jgi:GAF domain-containing protein
MRRRAKPAKGKADTRPSRSDQPSTTDDGARIRALEQRLAEALERLEASNRERAEAHEQQVAAAEILRVISRTPADVQPVFDAIVRNAVTLCGSVDGMVWRYKGDLVCLVGHHNLPPHEQEELPRIFPLPMAEAPLHRAVHAGAVKNLEDIETAPEVTPLTLARWRRRGIRSVLVVPMRRGDDVVGAIAVSHRDVGAFSASRVALLETFADQAVIAIENARLFTELEASNRELTEALDQQRATGEILQVISRSPTDVQPVFDAIARNARQLLDGHTVSVIRRIDDDLHLMAFSSTDAAGEAVLKAFFPLRFDRIPAAARVMEERISLVVTDTETDPEIPENVRELSRARGWRSVVWTPMIRDDTAIGMIAVSRREPGGFVDGEVALLKTFADQAVIAIENVRLFTELQASNRELTTALDKQTATSDILGVISRSQTDAQPVFEAILGSALRLLGAYSGGLTRIVGDQIVLVAITSTDPAGDAVQRTTYPQPLHSEHPHGQAIRSRAPFNVANAQDDPRCPDTVRSAARARGFRSVVAVPLLRHDGPLGAMTVTRREAGGFTDDEVALLRTFADQAVIAIENARLLSELQARTGELTRTVNELTVLGEVSRALSSTLDLETVLQTIVLRANELAGTAGCNIWEYDEPREQFHLRASHYADERDVALLRSAGRVTTIPRGQGVTTRVMERREPVQIADITIAREYESPVRQPLIDAGHRSLLAVPLMSEDEIIGVLAVTRKTPGEFEPETVRLLGTFATQSALAMQNARLFLEIEDKSRQLEVASQHKSEFLASMSHELRTPLNAILGFSEVLADGMFGEVNDKQAEYLRDILESGRHLLSLINDILDLSKIEAGRMELEPTDFDLPSAIDSSLTLVRERAGRRGIALDRQIDERVGMILGDERKVKQVVLNLLSNAIKFTPDGGRIDVRAAVIGGFVEVSVADTGVGIAPEDQERVFEEFRQVGTADRKVEGTGLGLALSRKFVELHGGQIWVKSQIDLGSTFTFTLPGPR